MAVKIPFELRVALREGSIFYFKNRQLTSKESHYHIVVNADPFGQELLLLTVVTSKVDKVKFRCRERLNTVVEICPTDLPEVLSKPSIVDCNSLTRISLEEFCNRWEKKDIGALTQDLPPPLRQKLRCAIYASTILPDEFKNLVRCS